MLEARKHFFRLYFLNNNVATEGAKLPASQRNAEAFLTRAQSSIRLGPPATFSYCSTHVLPGHAGDLEISIRVSSSRLRERRCLAHYASGRKESRVNFLLKVFPREWHTEISWQMFPYYLS